MADESMNLGELTYNITIGTGDVVRKCRIVAKHLTAMAEELEGDGDRVVGEQTDEAILPWGSFGPSGIDPRCCVTCGKTLEPYEAMSYGPKSGGVVKPLCGRCQVIVKRADEVARH